MDTPKFSQKTVMNLTLSESDLAALYWWPFPPPEKELGRIYDFDALRHTFADNMAVSRERSAPADERLRWVALATGAAINQGAALQQAAEKLGAEGEAVLVANRSALGRFVDGLVASPPSCDQVPFPPPGHIVIVGGVPVWVPRPPDPVPPVWEEGEQLSAVDLVSVGARLQAAATSTVSEPLRQDFLAAANRLFEAATSRM
jgi:hypothetical protein